MTELEKQMMENPDIAKAYRHAMDISDLMIVAPHKAKYYNRYNIQWLINKVAEGVPFKYVTFWKADEGEENNVFSQWYHGNPIVINGRSYATAEQYMMSEKALLFNDLEMYQKIMSEPDPEKCKKMGRLVKDFVGNIWDEAFPEIIFHGNLGKLQSDIEIVNALLETENAVLIEASPYDDIYGAGMKKEDLLNPDGTLRVLPQHWHKKDSQKQATNHLGFILMGVRDLFRNIMGSDYRPGEEHEGTISVEEDSFAKSKEDVFESSNGIKVDDIFWKQIEGREKSEEELHAIREWKNTVNVKGLLMTHKPKKAKSILIQKIGITDLSTDAIVNAANNGLWAGTGVCGAIFAAAGHNKLQAACEAIGHCDTGSAVITPGFDSKSKYIIHAVGPVWNGGNSKEPQLLYGAYRRALELAVENDCHSIGFPLLSAGVFGYPKDKAWRKAIQACRDFFQKNPDVDLKVTFAVLDEGMLSLGENALNEIAPEYKV